MSDKITKNKDFILELVETWVLLADSDILFEFNNHDTRDAAKVRVEGLADLLRKFNYIVDYYVECNELNNNEDAIKKGRFVFDIFIKFNENDGFTQYNIAFSKTDHVMEWPIDE